MASKYKNQNPGGKPGEMERYENTHIFIKQGRSIMLCCIKGKY